MIMPILAAAAAASPAAPAAAPPPITVVVAPDAPAQRKPPSAAAMKLVEAVQLDSRLDLIFSKLVPLMGVQVTTALEADPNTRTYVSELFAKLPGGRARLAALLSEEFQKELRKKYPDVERAVASGYDSIFTAAEIEELTRFFGSGVGAKYMGSAERLQEQTETLLRGIGEQAGRAAAPRGLHRAEAEAGMKAPDKTS